MPNVDHTAPIDARKITVMSLLRPHRRELAWGLLAIAGESIADLLSPWPLKVVLDNVLRGKSSHGWLNHFVQSSFHGNVLWTLGFACAAVIAIAILDAVCSYTEKYLTTSIGQWVTHDLRRALYSQVQRLSLSYHDHSQTGDLISRVTDDIDSIQTFIVSGLLGVLVDLVTLVGMVGVMLYINWQFTLIALAVVPLLFVIVYTYTRKVKKASREVRRHEGRLANVVQEVLGSIRVVKAFAREEYEVHRFEAESLETVEAALKARALKAKLVPLVNLITAMGTCAVLFFGARMALAGKLSVGTIVLFIAYLSKMYKPIQDISKTMDSYSKADVGYERIQEILSSNNEMPDTPDAREIPRMRGEIAFDHVSFSYEEGSPVLDDVTLHIQPGTTVALVGPTGAGKSTIVNMIARFYDATSGTVRVDGIDVRNIQQASLRQQISFVLQDTVLFSGTIWDNIAYGRPEATHAEIVEAARAANASEFIERMKDGYNTKVGERGITLSGGQRQRIAIARAIIRNSPILILDEPTAALDAESEHLVFEALDKLMAGKTSIVIAHRLSTVRKAQCIFVLEHGHVLESGSHEELMARGGLYASLHDIQFSDAEAMHPLLA